MTRLLDRTRLVAFSNWQALSNTDKYSDAYVTQVIQSVEDNITNYLQFNPALTVIPDEEGVVDYVGSGVYAGRYMITLKSYPLVRDVAYRLLSLSLTYPTGFAPVALVSLQYLTVQRKSGIVFALSPGASEALSFAIGGISPSLQATGYLANYTAGFLTGINDPLTPIGTQYNVELLPENYRKAAALLCREQIEVDDIQNDQSLNPSAGFLASAGSDSRTESYYGFKKDKNDRRLGYGTPLSAAARSLLGSAGHRRTFDLVG